MGSLFLVRHAETEWSKNGKHTGLSDLPLIDTGRREAQELVHILAPYSFDKVFVSPLQRARETCLLAGYGNHALVLPDLVEWDYGKYEGLTTEEIHRKDPTWSIFTKGAPGGESVAEIEARVRRVLQKVEEVPGNVILFSSGHFLRALSAIWLGLTIQEGRLFALLPASLSILGFERSTRVILLWNKKAPC